MAASLFGKRSTRFRHVYGSPAQKENCYDNIRISCNAHDSMFCAVNRQFLAVVLECAGGGGFNVLPLQRTGRIDHNAPKVCGHSAAVMDVKWNPFNDNIIASSSDDATVKLWEIPKGGIRSDLSRFSVDLRGHSRRVAYIEWHPTAENILLSAGFDYQSIVWNCEIGQPVLSSQAHPDVILSISWNRDGSLFASTCKDRTARIIDPRSGKAVLSWEPHQGSKTTKINFLGDTKQLFTTGFSQFAQRQYGLWDMRSLNRGALKRDNIDSSSGALFQFYDHDTRMIYLAGKGDGNIRYYELTNNDPFVHYLSEYQSPHPQKGLGVMPKLGLDTSRCEIFRFYKLHSNRQFCEPISMIAPRKSEVFQEDLYPPTASSKPALSAIEWIGGANRDPILVSIRAPNSAVSNPPMVTSKPVQLTGKISQSSQNDNDDNNKVPNSLRNIRKLVEGSNDPALNGHADNQMEKKQQRNSHINSLKKLQSGCSEQSIHSSDSVFERNARHSETERPLSPVAVVFENNGHVPQKENKSNGEANDVLDSEEDVKGRHSNTSSNVEKNNGINGDSGYGPFQPHPPKQPNPHHNNNNLVHPDDPSKYNSDHSENNYSGHAFHPVHSPRQLPPPLSLTIPPAEKPVSTGFVVQTAVQSPLSPSSSKSLHSPGEVVSPAQTSKFIKKVPLTNGMTDGSSDPHFYHHPHHHRHNNEDVFLTSQYRRGATGGNAYQSQSVPVTNNVSNSAVRSPNGRAIRPDILDVLQEQLSASSRELRSSTGPNSGITSPMHQAVVYTKGGPMPQAAHLQVGQVISGGTSGRSSRNMSPAERRIRNRTIAGAEGPHAFAPVGDNGLVPGSNFSSQRQLAQSLNAPMSQYQYPQHHQPHSAGSRRPQPPPVASRTRMPSGASSVASSKSNVAVVDVRDDMAPAMMRSNQQPLSPGLNRSQTMYIPVSDNHVNRRIIEQEVVVAPVQTSNNLGSAVDSGDFIPASNPQTWSRSFSKDRHQPNRPKRDSSAAPVLSRQQNHPSHQKVGESSARDGMHDSDLKSQVRQQREEINNLRKQCQAKDQVIQRLESELRHLVHQMQQRSGPISGAHALTAGAP